MKETSYNKKGNIQFCYVECLPNEMPIGNYKCDTYSNANECHFFISITRIVRIDKMIVMYLRTFITKILFFIFIEPPFYYESKVDTQQLIFPIVIIPNKCI